MKSWHTLLLFAAGAGAVSSSVPERSGARNSPIPRSGSVASSDSGFSVLTYNVHGLPWPLTTGRTEAFARIEERLLRLRSAGAQPHVVVLQEAFSDGAREIGAIAGYRYVVDGPDRDLRGAVEKVDAAYVAAASFTKGETIGKWEGSGLQILSDYPILAVRRMAFPALACAGYDCLANKGALMVELRVPGQPVPITIVTTHMNSKRSSGVPETRSRLAYELQAAALARFVRENHDVRTPVIFAGDFNASNDQRRQILLGNIAGYSSARTDVVLASALQAVSSDIKNWPDRLREEVAYISRRGRDWQFFASGEKVTIAPHRVSIPFGREPNGPMLSDHMGILISYRLKAKA
jgi:endonuclease/exonuclease/phosphatase family metal-dependent hydrolase